MVFSDNTVPHALCLTYDIERWAILSDVTEFFWEFGICGLQNSDLSDFNWNYIADWTDDFGLVASADHNGIFVSEESTYNDPFATFEAEGRVTSVNWGPHENYLLSVSKDRETDQAFIEVWSPSSNERTAFFPATEQLISATWSPDGHSISILAGAEENYTLSVIDALNGNIRFETDYSTTPAISWSPDERSISIVVGAEENYTLLVVDALNGNIRFETDFSTVSSMSWNPDGSQLAINSADTEGVEIDIIDGESGDLVYDVAVHDVTSFRWHPSGDWLAVSSGDELIIYDIEQQGVIASVESESRVIDWSPDGSMLATNSPGQIVSIWEINFPE
jgi:WD40 repeat protein